MRFVLFARGRATGSIRALSDRAFDSMSGAVDAATRTAHDMELGDDEVLAVDLDKAGPVLVLRIEVPAGHPEVDRAAEEAAAAAWSFVPDPEPTVRLQPRFPLFGAVGDDPDETLAVSLRRVARRMQQDLSGATLDEHDSAASAEGGEGSGSADVSEAVTRLPIEPMCEGEGEHLDVPSPSVMADPAEDEAQDSAREEASVREEAAEVLAEADALLESQAADLAEDSTESDEESVVVFAEALAPDDRPAAAIFAEPEPEPEHYRFSETNFTVWACGDCVYQRTCRRAGMSTPATCGNFLWRS